MDEYTNYSYKILILQLTLFLERVEVVDENKHKWDMHCCS